LAVYNRQRRQHRPRTDEDEDGTCIAARSSTHGSHEVRSCARGRNSKHQHDATPRTAATARQPPCIAPQPVDASRRPRPCQEYEMTQRLNYVHAAPGGFKALRDLQAYVEGSGLEHPLLELVKMRASQINGCAYCLDMHSKDARAAGETEQRLYVLNAWREAPFYSARERAALAWTEALTLVADSDISDELYAEVRQQFSEKELADLSFAIIAINGWNRLAIPFRSEPGHYQPQKKTTAA
jgi:AhpD family alkylhydroperoxidase